MIDQHTPASAAPLGLPARIVGFRASHWDLNALWQLREDVRAELPALDMEIVEDLQEMMGGDYQSLIRIYLEDSPKLIGQIQSALDNRDCAALVAPAHTLKSSSANLGAMALSDIAKTIEKSARNGDIETSLQVGAGMPDEFERVRAALAAIIA